MKYPYKGYFDGSSKPNPGMMKVGGYIENPDGRRITEIYSNEGYGTNNRAEYLAITFILQEAIDLGIREIEIYGDSKLVVNQVNGIWKSNKDMTPYKLEVQSLLESFDKWSLSWIKRELNSEADALTR